MGLKISRRAFFTASVGIAASAATILYFLTGMKNYGALQRRTIEDVLNSIGRNELNPSYLSFLEWLIEASGNIEGTRAYIALMAESTGLGLQRIERDFYYASMIDSKLDISPYPVHVSKTLSTLSVGTSIYDVVAVEAFDVTLYRQYLRDLSDMPERFRDYTFERFRLDDFLPPALNLVCYYPPTGPRDVRRPVLLPFSSPTIIRFYRSDLYERLGRKPANTWEEYIEDLKDLKDQFPEIFATALQLGSDVGTVTEFNNLVFSYGGKLFDIGDREATPSMDSYEVVEALEVYARIRPYADPASISYDWDTVANAMRRGRIATALLWQDFAWMMDDPDRSTVVGKVRYAKNPSGPSGSYHQFIGDGLGITTNSKNPVAAWLWMQWATETGTRIELTLDKRSLSVPIRLSVFEYDKVKSAMTQSGYESIRIVKQALDSGELAYIPPIPKSNQVMFSIARHVRSAWAGRDPRMVVREMSEEVEALGPFIF